MPRLHTPALPIDSLKLGSCLSRFAARRREPGQDRLQRPVSLGPGLLTNLQRTAAFSDPAIRIVNLRGGHQSLLREALQLSGDVVTLTLDIRELVLLPRRLTHQLDDPRLALLNLLSGRPRDRPLTFLGPRSRRHTPFCTRELAPRIGR